MQDIFERIKFKNDGVYFLVDYNSVNIKNDILNIVNEYNIEDINYEEIEKDIEEKKEYVLLTRNKDAININEKLELIISQDNMFAEGLFYAPKKGGNFLTKDDILKQLDSLGIKYGINIDNIDKFLEEKSYTKTYLLAEGTRPGESKDGYLEYFVDINEKKIKPTVLEDGTIDYKKLNWIECIRKGTKLVAQVQPIRGEEGKDIFDNPAPSVEPKEAPKLPMGKNTEVCEEDNTLIASIDGCLFNKNNLISILPSLETKGNVDNSTGNIEFVGNVIVNGNVLDGFCVKAEGNIEIKGWMEGATVISTGDISVAKGVQGANKAKIVAGGNVSLNFVENATIIAEKDVSASSIMHCNISCNGNLTVFGKKGLILGSKCIVAKNILVKDIGSPMSNNTELTVGINYMVLNKYNELLKEIESKTKRYDELEKITNKFSQIELQFLQEDKRILLEMAVKEKLLIKRKILANKKEIKKLIPLFMSKKGSIKVTNLLHSGTKVVANNAVIFIKEDIDACVLKNIDGKVKVIK